jgi:hypothetical protein
MSPRVLDTKQCPHCRGALERPTPRVCPHCAGSLQQRFFKFGCLSSAPPVLLVAGAVAWSIVSSAHRASARDAQIARDERATASADARACSDGPDVVAIEARRP